MNGLAGRRLVAIAASLLGLAGCGRAPVQPQPIVQAAEAEQTSRVAGDAAEPAALRATPTRFDMVPGTTLRETLERWSAASGWTVRWASDRAYPIKGRATFEGDFVQAAGDLIRSFRALNPPPIARFYMRNHELRVVTPGDEMGE
jgi:hypothetical protein